MGIGVVGGTVGGRVGCDRARGADLAHRWTLQFRQVAGGRLDILSWWLYIRGGGATIYMRRSQNTYLTNHACSVVPSISVVSPCDNLRRTSPFPGREKKSTKWRCLRA